MTMGWKKPKMNTKF